MGILSLIVFIALFTLNFFTTLAQAEDLTFYVSNDKAIAMDGYYLTAMIVAFLGLTTITIKNFNSYTIAKKNLYLFYLSILSISSLMAYQIPKSVPDVAIHVMTFLIFFACLFFGIIASTDLQNIENKMFTNGIISCITAIATCIGGLNVDGYHLTTLHTIITISLITFALLIGTLYGRQKYRRENKNSLLC